MFEMPHSGHYQCKFILLAVFNRIFVTDRTTRLNKSCDACLVSQFYAIAKWEKCIAGHNSSMQIKLELVCFFNRLSKRVDTTGLTTTFAKQLFIFYKGDRITF